MYKFPTVTIGDKYIYVKMKAPFRGLRLYISGQITGDKDFREKFAKAEKVAKWYGFKPVNPCKREPDGKPWVWYMKRDIKKLLKCDAILMLPDWCGSRGARLERRIAYEMGLRRFVAVNVFKDMMIVEGDSWDVADATGLAEKK